MAPSVIKKMFEQDFSEPQDWNLAMSQEDLKFMSITSNGIYKADDGNSPTTSQRELLLTMQQETR